MILYFSGTGNSLFLAKQLAEQLNDTLLHIEDIKGTGTKIHDKHMGIVCPVYFGDIPEPVRDFLENSYFDRTSYIFSVVTCGGSAGQALRSIKKILQRKKCRLSYGKVLRMPSNSTVAFRSAVSYKLHYLAESAAAIHDIAGEIRSEKIDTSACSWSLMGSVFSIGPVTSWSEKLFTVTVDPAKCNGCGICAQLCPQNNITLDDSGTYIGTNCSHCMACVHWCPAAAIKVRGRSVAQADQYHHPGISLQDMIRR